MERWTIRSASADDAAELRAIYDHYVCNTATTFEYDTPSCEAFAERIIHTEEKYPYFVIEDEDRITGFAFAHAFRERPAYDYAAETTIYLHPDERHKGYGRLLYAALETELRRMGVRSLYACIAVPEKEDEHLTFDSPCFHESFGFHRCGTFSHVGYKFGRWYTMIWMEKTIGVFSETPAALVPYPTLIRSGLQMTGELSDYDDKPVRLITKDSGVFWGIASCFDAGFGYHEYNAEEEGMSVGVYVVQKSDIADVQVVDLFGKTR